MPQKDKVKRHKKTKRNATKRQSETPQKDKVKCHKKTKSLAPIIYYWYLCIVIKYHKSWNI